MNSLTFLRRLCAQPWAMREIELHALTQTFARHLKLGAAPEHVARIEQKTRAEQAAVTVKRMKSQAVIVSVWGVLGRGWEEWEKDWCGAFDVDDLMEDLASIPDGQPVCLWFRSPGGYCGGIPETAAFLREFRKTHSLTAFTDDLCCSAAYWLAAQCDSIIATPTADLGSIGVYSALYDWTKYLEDMGVTLELFKAGNMKAMGLPGNPLSDEEREHMQARVDECYRQFTDDITANRAIDTGTMQGQTYVGAQAQARNLCDGFSPSARDFFASL
jgi:signal peptide peptidase SppA